MDLDRRGGGKELGGVEVGKTLQEEEKKSLISIKGWGGGRASSGNTLFKLLRCST